MMPDAGLPMFAMRPWQAQSFALDRLKSGGKGDPVLEEAGKAALLKERKALRQAAREFESIFMGLVVKSMRDSVPKNELFHGGPGEDTFQGMLDAEYANKLSASGGFGIADAIVRQFDRPAPMRNAEFGMQNVGNHGGHSSIPQSAFRTPHSPEEGA